MKKVSYIQLLKEAISEYDAKSMDYKGPLTDPIITFDGDGELETHKDASSILERYYFDENKEKLIEQDEEVGPDNPVDVDEEADAEDPNNIVTGEEPDDVDDSMEDFEDDIMEEDLELEDYDPEDPDIVAKDEPLEDEKAAPMNNEILSLENTVIEKLIQEMEDEEKADGGEAGTDLVDDKEAEDMLEDIDLLEAELEADAEEEEDDDKDDKDLDVDKKIEAEVEGMGPIRIKAAREVEEAFNLFKEQIEEEEKEEEDEKKEKEDGEEEIEEDEEIDVDLDDEEDEDSKKK